MILDTDANLALVAEWRYGAAQDADNVAMLTIGTGIGGAALLGGRLLRGRRSGGQFGHLTVDHDGLPCACGRLGCVETTSSGTALRRLIAEAGMPAETRVEKLLAAADDGDRAARAVCPLVRTASCSARQSPRRAPPGNGWCSAAGRRCGGAAPAFAPALSPWYQAPVVAARLGDAAGVIGAAWAAANPDRIA